jgi:hypothetical protein
MYRFHKLLAHAFAVDEEQYQSQDRAGYAHHKCAKNNSPMCPRVPVIEKQLCYTFGEAWEWKSHGFLRSFMVD